MVISLICRLTSFLIRPVALGIFDVVVESSRTVESLVDAVVAKVVDGAVEDVADEKLTTRGTTELLRHRFCRL